MFVDRQESKAPLASLDDCPSPEWYAIRTRSRHENRVLTQIEGRGIEGFLPLISRRRQWRDRRVEVAFPLFSGYCFARFPWPERLRVLTAFGVVGLVGINGHAEPVPDHEIQAVMRLVTCTLPVDPHPYIEEGDTVEVIRGPLAGMRGLLLRKDRSARFVISLNLIRQGASVALDAADIAPV